MTQDFGAVSGVRWRWVKAWPGHSSDMLQTPGRERAFQKRHDTSTSMAHAWLYGDSSLYCGHRAVVSGSLCGRDTSPRDGECLAGGRRRTRAEHLASGASVETGLPSVARNVARKRRSRCEGYGGHHPSRGTARCRFGAEDGGGGGNRTRVPNLRTSRDYMLSPQGVSAAG